MDENRVTDIKSFSNLLLVMNFEVQRFGHDGFCSHIYKQITGATGRESQLSTLHWYNYLNEKKLQHGKITQLVS